MAATHVNQRTMHVINNTIDPSLAPNLFQKQVVGYPGNGYGGKVQDASTYTLSLGSRALGQDNFSSGRIVTNVVNSSGDCLTRPPASQVVSEWGNADDNIAGLNMGYTRQMYVVSGPNSPALIGSVQQTGVCTSDFYPLTKSYFVDTIPDLKIRKIGTHSRDCGDGGRQVVQDTIVCTTTNTSGVALNQLKADIPFNSYSALPNNSTGSGPNLVHGAFVTSRTGPQTGGGNTPGSRAAIVGGVTLLPKHSITHRGWANRTRSPYPHPFVPPRGAPAHLKINDPNHYKF
jgi:hypothetical protein